MVKLLLCVVGILLAVGGVAGLWYGFEMSQSVEKLEQQIGVDTSEKTRGGSPARMEAIEKSLADSEREKEAQTKWMYVSFVAGAVGVLVGATLAMLPLLGPPKRRAKSRPAEPAQSADVAGDGAGQ